MSGVFKCSVTLTSFPLISASLASRSSQLTSDSLSGGCLAAEEVLGRRNEPVSALAKRPIDPRRDRTSGDGTVGLVVDAVEGEVGTGAGAGVEATPSCERIC